MQRYMRGMSRSHAISANGHTPLTLDEIADIVPAVFADQAHDSRSGRYAYIPTSQILTKLADEGFDPFFAQQAKSRIEGKENFTKHMVRLRHQSRTNDQNEAHEIILVNSHDGTSSYQMMSGIFRFVCSNGLFSGDMFGDVKIRHTGEAMGEVIEGAYRVLGDADELMDRTQEMKATNLSYIDRLAYADAAYNIRYENTDTAPIKPERLLEPARRDDMGTDLWSTFNTVQENLIRGGQRGLTRNKKGRLSRKTTRPITSIDQTKTVNKRLTNLTDHMLDNRRAA